MVEEKINLSYKEFDSSNIEKLFSNKKLLKELYFVRFGKHFREGNIKILESKLHEYFRKQYSTFIILKNKKAIGFSTGVILDKSFISVYTYVHKDYQNNSIGKKLVFRKLAYLIHRKGVTEFQNTTVLNNKIYSINEAFVKRKNLSKKYHPELNLKKESYINKKTKEKRFKNNIIIKKPR